MHGQGRQQAQPSDPEQASMSWMESSVAIERFGPQVDLEVPEHMDEDESDQYATGRRNEVLDHHGRS